jgi:putative flippase GtrA
MLKSFFSKQFVLFLFTGGIAAIANFSSRILYNLWMNYSVAIVLAYLTGMATAFILAKVFVFKEGRQNITRSAWIFSLVNLTAVVQTWGISLLLVHYLLPWLGMKQFVHEMAHAVGIIIPVFTSYVGHKRWSFR